MSYNGMLKFQLDDLRVKFTEKTVKDIQKKEDLLYGIIQLFFHYKTYNGGFFKNKECIGNNK